MLKVQGAVRKCDKKVVIAMVLFFIGMVLLICGYSFRSWIEANIRSASSALADREYRGLWAHCKEYDPEKRLSRQCYKIRCNECSHIIATQAFATLGLIFGCLFILSLIVFLITLIACTRKMAEIMLKGGPLMQKLLTAMALAAAVCMLIALVIFTTTCDPSVIGGTKEETCGDYYAAAYFITWVAAAMLLVASILFIIVIIKEGTIISPMSV